MSIEDCRDPLAGAPDACPDSEQLAVYADGAMGAAECGAIERHLADCADCRTVLAETTAFVRAEDGVPVLTNEPLRSPRDRDPA